MEWYKKRTLGSLLDTADERFGERTALLFEGQSWTFAEWRRQSDRLAKGLMAMGVEPGDRVALWMTNRPEWLFAMFAVAKIGACLVPLNTRYRTDDIAYTLAQSRSSTLISLARSGPIDYAQMLAEAIPDVGASQKGNLALSAFPELRRIVFLEDSEPQNAVANCSTWAELEQLSANISDQQLEQRAIAVDPDGLMVIAYTSGTTGHPKGVTHTHIPIRSTHERTQVLGMTFDDVHLNYLPLFHLYAYSEISIAAVICGAKQVLMDVFDADRALDLAEREGATVLHGFEAHWLDLLAAQKRNPRSFSMRLGTLPSGVESTIPVADEVQDVFGPTISGWGMSEAWAFVTMSNPSHSREQRVNASGYPANDYEFRVVDPETGADCAVGTSGELLIRGYAVTPGYWDKAEATSAAIDDQGWLHSGDMAMFRKDGHMVFQGRYKDMLKVGGENVSPAEMEAYLRDMPEIADAAVVAYPDKRLAEVPIACVLASGTEPIDEDAILNRFKGRIASFKIPRRILTLEAFPMTPSGKIRKVELRAMLLDQLGDPLA